MSRVYWCAFANPSMERFVCLPVCLPLCLSVCLFFCQSILSVRKLQCSAVANHISCWSIPSIEQFWIHFLKNQSTNALHICQSLNHSIQCVHSFIHSCLSYAAGLASWIWTGLLATVSWGTNRGDSPVWRYSMMPRRHIATIQDRFGDRSVKNVWFGLVWYVTSSLTPACRVSVGGFPYSMLMTLSEAIDLPSGERMINSHISYTL